MTRTRPAHPAAAPAAPAAEHRRLHVPRLLRHVAVGLLSISVALPVTALAPAAPAAVAAEAPAYGAPDEIAADYYGALLRHTRWTETVWDSTAGVYRLTDFNFAVVLGNAVLLTHGEYDAQVTGVPKETLRQKTIATITHYAAKNRFVDPNGTWGKRLFWDSTFQSYFLAAGKLMWDELDAATRANLTTIAAEQSRYTADLDYGRDPLSGGWTADWPNGKYEGDTAQEEAGVYTQALAPGLAWAPQDADAGRWSDQLGDWARNAAGQPTADRNNPAVVAGKPISSNTMQTIRDTYLVENHGSFGPHYQSDVWRSGGRNAIHFLLNDRPLPEILTRQPNSAELWESIKLVMSAQGEPFMPMVADREYLYGRDVLPIAFLGQVLRDPDAVRAEASLAAALEDYQAYAPVDRLTKFSGEPKYEPEARAEIAISYLLHVEAAESEQGVVQPTPADEFFSRLAGARDFGAEAGLTVHQTERAWAAAASRTGFVKFPWVPEHDSWLFDVSGNTPFLYPRTGATVTERNTTRYTSPGDGVDATASLYAIGDGRAGQVTLPTGSAIYASSGAGRDDASLTVRNLALGGYNGLDGTREYTTAEGSATGSVPVVRPADALDANANRVDTLDFTPVTARYVRMQGIQGNPTFGYSMYAFHVYGADPASATDLALGKPALASSQDVTNNRQASRVTDSTASSRWAVATAERTRADSWIQVDLGQEHMVGGVRLAWESSAGARYLVQTSTDGVTWSTQRTFGPDNPADVNVARLDTLELTPAGATSPAPVEARYVRMQGVQGNPTYGYSLYHLRALTAAGTDAAAGKPVTASSAEATRPASAVTDGSATTRWAVAVPERLRADSWVQVDLGAPTAIAKVQLGWEAAAGREYRIQTSLDGETWSDAARYRFTGDQIISTDGDWLNIEAKAGFVVRGSDAPLTVARETDSTHLVRLVDGETGGRSPFLVEMVPADAKGTAATAASPQPTVDTAGVMASTLDGYLSLFNLTGAAAAVEVTVPHDGDTVSLFDGAQRVGADASTLSVTVPAGTAMVLAPRFELSRSAIAAGLVVDVQDGRELELRADAAGEVPVRNVETDQRRTARLTEGDATALRFLGATPFPVRDLALRTLTFPASVLPEGMTSPALAVDGDADTAWTPGPDGRMVVDLGAAREIGTVSLLWDGAEGVDAMVAVSDDGFAFTDVAEADAASAVGSDALRTVEIDRTARYVAITTEWSAGDADLTALRVLAPGAEQDVSPGEIEGDLPALRVGRTVTGSLTADGSPTPEFTVTAGELPEGVTLDASGVLGGTPASTGDYAFTVTASNGVGTPTTRGFTGTVSALGLTITADPATPNGGDDWYTGDVTLTATAEGLDLAGRLEVDVDGAGWSTVTAPVVVTGDGEHEVAFRVTDGDGGVLEEQRWSGRIDSASPVSSATVDEAARTVTVRAADATSGLARIEVRVADGEWIAYDGPVTVGDAQTTVQFRAIDKAGNVETTAEVMVPKAGVILTPTLTAAIIADDAVRYFDRNSVTVRVTGAGGTPSGTVAVIAGEVEVGSASLSGGRATVTLDRALLLPGSHELRVVYSGDARFESSSDTVDLLVSKAKAGVKAGFVDKSLTTKQTPQVKVVVSSTAPVTGTVTIKQGTKTVRADVKLVGGTATVTLPKLKRGTHKFVAHYSGSDTVGSARSVTFTVAVR